MTITTSHAWRLDVSEDIATLTLDVPGQSANTLSAAVLDELEQVLTQLESQPMRGLMIVSAKPGGFIAGADVREFEQIDDAAHATELARRGQTVFGRLARLPFPSVAVIHGDCLGGGCTLACACLPHGVLQYPLEACRSGQFVDLPPDRWHRTLHQFGKQA